MTESDCILPALGELVFNHGTPLELAGPISEDHIAAAEEELGVVFPPSYRTFLRHFGAGNVHFMEIYGIPGDRLWGDVVMMTQLASPALPNHYVKLSEDFGGCAYCLDTSRPTENGECPVVTVAEGMKDRVVANSFLDFLRKASEGKL